MGVFLGESSLAASSTSYSRSALLKPGEAFGWILDFYTPWHRMIWTRKESESSRNYEASTEKIWAQASGKEEISLHARYPPTNQVSDGLSYVAFTAYRRLLDDGI